MGTLRILSAALVLFVAAQGSAFSQIRDLRAQRLIIDDSLGNTIKMQTSASGLTSYTLTWPLTAGTNNYVLVTNGANGVLSWKSVESISNGWGLNGNTLTGTEVLGSLNGQPLVMVTNGSERLRVTALGNIGIGNTNPLQKLQVSGNILVDSARQVQFQNPAGTFASTFQAGAQTGNINYTLPISAPVGNGYLLSSTTGGAMSWVNPLNAFVFNNGLTISNDTVQLGGALTKNTSIPFGTNNLTLSAVGNTGDIIIGKFATKGIVKNSSTGVLSTGKIILSDTTEITGTLGIGNGGTNNTIIGAAGTVAYSDGTKYTFNPAGTTGQILQLSGTTPTWTNISSIVKANNGLSMSSDTVQLGGTLTKNAVISQDGFNVIFEKSGTGNVQLTNTNNSANQLRFYEPNANGGSYTSFRAGPQTLDINYMLPTVGPTNGQILSSTSAGVMSWTSVGSLVKAVNGLSNIGTDSVALGGTLIQNTSINIGTNDLTLSGVGNTGNVIIGKFATKGIVKNTSTGILSTGKIILSDTTEITGTLGIGNGGTNNTIIGAAGTVAYSDGTKYTFSPGGSTGQILQLSGTIPTWTNISSIVKANNGLSLSTDTVQLGGALTKNTSIPFGTNNLTLSAVGNTGDIIIGKFATKGLVKNSATGVLSTGKLLLNDTTEVSGTLGIINGGTNNNVGGSAGQVLYYDGTKYNYTTTGTTGQILQSNNTGAPTWVNVGGLVKANNGVSLAGDTVQLGGALTKNTSIPFGTNNLTLSAVGNTGDIIIGKFATKGIVKNSATGVLSTGKLLLNDTTEVNGTLGIINGGTNNNVGGSAGQVLYYDGTKYNYTTTGTTGQILQSNNTGAPSWVNVGSLVKANNGVSLSGDTVQLGGALVKNTTITHGAFDVIFQKSGSGTVNLTNNNNSAQQIRFYEPSGSGGSYSAFQAGAQTADIVYTLPTAAPSANGQILSGTTAGVLSWTGVGSLVKAGNGLINVGADSVLLGGALTQNTTINFGTKDLTLSTPGNTGNVSIGKFTTAGIVKNSAAGVLSTGQINLSSSTDVSGTLGITNGGTNNNTAGSAGQVLYYDGTKYNYTATGAIGQILQSNNTGAPSWVSVGSLVKANNGLTLSGDTVQLGGTLIKNTTVTGGAFDMIFQKSGTGNVNLTNNNNTANQLRFYEPSTSGSNYTAFQAAVQTGDVTYTLPTGAPSSNGQILSGTTAGVLSWTSASSLIKAGNGLTGVADSVILGGALTQNTTINVGTRDLSLSASGNTGNIIIGKFTTAGIVKNSAAGILSTGQINLASSTDVSGTLGITNGGTNNNVAGSAGQVLYYDGTKYNYTATGAIGQILQSNNTGAPSWVSVGSLVKANNGLTLSGDTVQLGGTLIENTTVTGGAFDMIFQKSGTGNVNLTNSNNTANQLRFYEPSTSGTNYTAFQAAAQTGDVTYTLPTGAPSSNGQILSGTTAGVLSWTSASSLIKAGNGLTGVADSVILGGALTQNTTINVGTRDLSLSTSGNTGNIIIGKFTTAGIVKNSAAGVLSSGAVNLNSTEVTGTLGIVNGGTNNTTIGGAGTVVYSDGSKYVTTTVGTTGQILQSNNTGAPTWINPTSLYTFNNGLTLTGSTAQLGGTLIQNTTVTGGAFDMIFQKSGAGNVNLTNSNNTANQLRFYEPSTSGTNFTAFQAAAQTGDVTYTLPTGAPSSNGQILSGTTAGVLSWTSASNLIKSGNGLTGVADSVILGGALTQNTTINVGTRDLSLSASGNTGNVIIGKFTSAGIVKNSAAGVLSSGTVNLGSGTDVSGTLNVSNGGTGSTTVGAAGTIAYSDGTKYMFSTVGTTGQLLVSGGTGQPTWTSPTSIYTFNNGLTLTGSTAQLGGTLIQNTTVTGGAFEMNFQKSGAGNVNLTNNNNTANQLRFYEPSTSGTNYTALQAAPQAADITYTLPAAAPTISGHILQSTTAGVMSWIDPATAANAWSLTGNTGTNPSSTNFLGTTDGQDLELRVQGSPLVAGSRRLRFFTSGAIQRADGTALPNAPGTGSVDFQSTRTAAQVATGANSVISGGGNNTASNQYATISGGQTNVASGSFSSVGGGQTNSTTSSHATIAGGSGNTANGNGAAIGGGTGNTAGTNSAIPGGNGLTVASSSFGFSGSNNPTTATALGTNIGYFGDVDLIIGNIDNSARGLRFYEPNASGSYVGAHYTSFKAGIQAADINYILPVSIPTASNKGVLTTDNTGVLTWQSYPNTQNVITGSGVATRIAFWSGTSELSSDADLYWDDVNDRLGLGLTTPQALFHQHGGASAAYQKITNNTTGSNSTDGFDMGIDASGNAELRQRENLPMILYTNNTEQARITSGGDMSIGVGTTPRERLHLNNSGANSVFTRYTNSTTGTGTGDGTNLGIDGSGNTVIRQRENLPMIFYTNDNERMRILSGGNVGISTNNAPELFSVDNGNSYFRGVTTGGTVNYMELRNQNNTAYELRFFEPDGGGTNYNAFKTATQNQTITYTLPSNIPAVNEVLTATTVTGTGPYQVSLTWTTSAGGGNQDAVHGTGVATEVAFWADDSTLTSDSRLYWDDANLRLGIGTNVPSQSLETQGNILISNGNTAAQELRFQEPNATSSANEYTGFRAQAQSNSLTYTLPAAGPASGGNGSNRFALSTDNTGNSATLEWNTFWTPEGNAGVSSGFLGTTDAQPLVIRTNNSERMRVLSGGNVGIGASNPGQLLETMNGNVLLNNNNNTAAQLRFAEPSSSGANYTAFRALAQTADITYSLPIALPTNNGFMQTDNTGVLSWTAIPSGQSVITGTGTATRVAFWSNTTELSSDSDLYWDNTNDRLGIGTSAPSQVLEVMNGNTFLSNNNNTAAQLRFQEPSTSGSSYTAFQAVAQAANITYSLPSALPTNNGFMQSTNTGTLSWTGIPAGESVITGTGVATRVTFWNSATSLSSDANLYWDNPNNRLGIGTAAPTQSLEILNGNAYLSNDNNVASQLRFQEPSASGAHYSSFRAVPQANNFFYQLPAVGPSAINQTLIVSTLSGAAGDTTITLAWGNGASNDWALLGNAGTDSTTNFLGTTNNRPIIFKTNSTENMRIVGNTGYVGIGTNAPSAKLSVTDASARTAAFTAGLITNSATSSTASINKTGLDIQSTGNWTGSSARNIGLNVSVSGGTTNYSALFNGGNVGAGTSTPNVQIDVDGGLAVRPNTQTINSSTSVTVGNRSYIRLTHNGTGSANYTLTLSNGLQDGQILVVQFNGCTGTEKLIFNDSGNLNLSGVFSPSATQSTITFVWDGSSWVETARSLN